MEKSIGALWLKVSENVGEYWTGNIELEDGTKQKVIVFRNTNKTENQPDLRIYKQKQKDIEEDQITDDSDLPF